MPQNRHNVISVLVTHKKIAAKADKEVFDYLIAKMTREKTQCDGKKNVRLADGTRRLIPEKKAIRLLKKPVSERFYG